MKQKPSMNKTFASSFSSLLTDHKQPQVLKIRDKKLQNKFSQRFHKLNTSQKLVQTNLTDIDHLQLNLNSSRLESDKTQPHTTRQKGKFISTHTTQEQHNRNKNHFQFLTTRDLLQKNLRNKQFTKKTTSLYNQHSKNIIQPITSNQDNTFRPYQPQLPQTKQHQKLQTKQFISKLHNQTACYDTLWQKFLKSVKEIQKNQQELCLADVCQQDRSVKLLEQFMKEMDYLIHQHDLKIQDTLTKLTQIRQTQLKRSYIHLHQLHQKYMHTKTVIAQHKLQYEKYLQKLKEQQRQKRLMLQSKRQMTTYNSTNSPRNNSPLRYLHDLNLSDKDVKQVIQKKSKLNLQLDLSFQIQHRKKIAQEKQSFAQKKKQLQKQQLSIQNKIKQTKQKIQFKEKQTERYEFQNNKQHRERQYFLKMLLNNPQYRLDGVLWTFKKMIQYGHQPSISDFSQNLDFDAKNFLLNEFNIIKQQQVFKVKPIVIKRAKNSYKKDKKPTNRQRVKSVTLFNSHQNQQNPSNLMDDLNSNYPPNSHAQAFFTFGSRNLKQPQSELKIRKKSGSLTLMKSYAQSVSQIEQYESKINSKSNFFKALTKQNNQKKIYLSAKKYIKNWINQEGWKACTARVASKIEQPKISDKFLSQQKTRAKHTFFKIGRPNTRYNSVIRTLYGSQEELKTTRRRIKTSRQ